MRAANGKLITSLALCTLACGGGSAASSPSESGDESEEATGATEESGGAETGDGDGDTTGTDEDPDIACSGFFAGGENIDECQLDNGGCGADAVCIDQEGAPAACTLELDAHLEALTGGMAELGHEFWPSSGLLLPGRRAFSVVGDGAGLAVVAAAEVEAGRVVAWGESRFLSETSGVGVSGAAQLAENAARWVGRSSNPKIGVATGMGDLVDVLSGSGLDAAEAELSELEQFDVYVPATAALGPDDVDLLRQWTAAGGGLLVAGSALSTGPWGYPALGLLWDAGIITAGHEARVGADVHGAFEQPAPLYNASWAAVQLRRHLQGEMTLTDEELSLARQVTDLSTESLSVPDFADYFCSAERFADAVGPIIPTESEAIEQYLDPLAALALRVDHRIGWGRPAPQVGAHESASYHPGLLPEGATPVTRTLTIDGSYSGRDARYVYANAEDPVWRGTGLYAAPGEHIEVGASGLDGGEGLELQIGIHSDVLWMENAWQRMPEMVRRASLRDNAVLASPYGGPVFVRVPAGSELGSFDVEITGAYAAPRFILGTTSNAEWNEVELAYPAPWAELESDSVIFSVPSSLVAELDDPEALMELWSQILDADAVLAGISTTRDRPERFVFDHQISAGLLHSGYPIMGLWSTKDTVVDREGMLANGEWGPLHELGHNHQWREWNLPGTTEGHVNLWSVYASETVLGVPREVAHDALSPTERAARIQSYLDGGANFEEDWSVWTALETYLQLQEGFGWEPFSSLFTNYYHQVPITETWNTQLRIDNFTASFAQEVQRDLGPFFTSWGFPLSQSVLDEMALLPPWTENPMP
jgi:hypothetical protein